MNPEPPERGHWGWLALAIGALLVVVIWVWLTFQAFG